MPAVPGFTPTPPPEPNHKELDRLREVERRSKEREAKRKREQLRDNHLANNPMPEFEVPRRKIKRYWEK